MTDTAIASRKDLVVDDDYPILPSDIDLAEPPQLPGVFGSPDVDGEAALIVLFCQQRDSWKPFRLQEFSTWRNLGRGPRLYDLKYGNRPLVVREPGEDGRFAVTHLLVSFAFADHPASSFSDDEPE